MASDWLRDWERELEDREESLGNMARPRPPAPRPSGIWDLARPAPEPADRVAARDLTDLRGPRKG